MQVLLNTMEHCYYFNYTFSILLVIYTCRDLDGYGIVPYPLPKRF